MADELYSEEAAFLAAIEANPCDCTVRAVYADWLQDRVDERWRFQAAIANHGIVPQVEYSILNQHKREVSVATWFRNRADPYERFGLPRLWYEFLPRFAAEELRNDIVRRHVHYVSYFGVGAVKDAYAEAAAAWDMLPLEIQDSILAPEVAHV